MPDHDAPKPPSCMTCAHKLPNYRGQPYLYCVGPQRARTDAVRGGTRVAGTCEYERSRIWRWFGRNTCGPEGRYWEQDKPPAPRPASSVWVPRFLRDARCEVQARGEAGFDVGYPGNAAGDLWLTPSSLLQCGKASICLRAAENARMFGWRWVEEQPCGRVLVHRTLQEAVAFRRGIGSDPTQWHRSIRD